MKQSRSNQSMNSRVPKNAARSSQRSQTQRSSQVHRAASADRGRSKVQLGIQDFGATALNPIVRNDSSNKAKSVTTSGLSRGGPEIPKSSGIRKNSGRKRHTRLDPTHSRRDSDPTLRKSHSSRFFEIASELANTRKASSQLANSRAAASLSGKHGLGESTSGKKKRRHRRPVDASKNRKSISESRRFQSAASTSSERVPGLGWVSDLASGVFLLGVIAAVIFL